MAVASRLRIPLILVALTALLRLVVGRALVNYDTLYALVWGRDIGHGHAPDYGVLLAPTPHPLQTMAAAVLSPLSSLSSGGVHGGAALTIVGVGAFVAMALVGWLVFELGSAWFHPWVGALAAAILLTRRPFLDFGARAYIDLPYLGFVLGALLVETKRPRAGAPVLVLLGLAGLIRPEAWLFSGVYVLWLRDWRLVWLAAAAPVIWLGFDLVITGNPLYSLTGTRDNAQTLGRVTGLQHVPTTMPRRLGEILRPSGLLGAAGGGVLSLWLLRDRAGVRVGTALGVLAVVAFSALATAGLPIIGRYLLLPSAILAIFCGAGLAGWLALPKDHAWRRPWQAFAVLTAVVFVALGPTQVNAIRGERRALNIQNHIQDDLHALVRGGELRTSCGGGVSVPNHRPVPLLALWLDAPPSRITSPEEHKALGGTFLATASPQIAKDYVLDPRDPIEQVPRLPAGYRVVGGNASWKVALDSTCE